MKELLLCLLACTLAGAWAGTLILLLKKLMKDRLSPLWHCYVWLVVVALLLVPLPTVTRAKTIPDGEILFVESYPDYVPEQELQETELMVEQEIREPASIVEQETAHSVPTTEISQIPQTPVEKSAGEESANKSVEKSADFTFRFVFPDWGWTALGLLWLGGVLFFLGNHLLSYRNFVSKLNHTSHPAKESTLRLLKETEKELGIPHPVGLAVTSLPITPMIVGLRKPTLYLPEEGLPEEQLKLIFIHELCHYKYGDLYYKELATILRGIHWFNPICAAMVEDIDFSCELLCDRRVTKQIGEGRSREYSTLLLELLGMNIHRSNPSATFSMDKMALKRRLSLIMKPRNTSKALCLLLTAALVFTGAACSAAVAPEIEVEPQETEIQQSVTKNATIPKSAEALAGLDQTIVSTTVENNFEEWLGEDAALNEGAMFFPLPEGTDYQVTETYNPEEPSHLGLDLTAEAGTELYASIDGEVVRAGYQDGQGNTVQVWSKKANLIVTYDHCEELLVQAGDTVKAGQVIATLGKTGDVTGNCLHIEICKDSIKVNTLDPARFFPELHEYIYAPKVEYAHVWEEITNLPYAVKDFALARVTAAVHVLEMTEDENAIPTLKEYLNQLDSKQKETLANWWFDARTVAQSLLTDSRDAILEESGYGAADLSAYSVEGLIDLDDKVVSVFANSDVNIKHASLAIRKLSYQHNDQYCEVETSIPPLENPCVRCGGTLYYYETFISEYIYGYNNCVDGAEDHGDQMREREQTRQYQCLDCGKAHVIKTVEKIAVHLDGFPSWWQY